MLVISILISMVVEIYKELKKQAQMKEIIRKWIEEDSFEHNGVRYNKLYWKLVNNKIESIEE